MKKIITVLAVFLLAAAAVYAQTDEAAAQDFSDETKIILEETADAAAGEAPVEDGRFFTTWDFIRVILILLAVIAVIYAVFYFLKKAGGGKFQDDELIRLLSSRSLTQNASVHLIEVGSKYYLVGCGDGSVSHIADIDDKETVDDLMIKNPPAAAGGRTFADLFNFKLGGKTPQKQGAEAKIRNNNKFMRDQAERLKKM